MGRVHDNLTTFYGDAILEKIRLGDKRFQQIFSSTITRCGGWDWPRPDYVCYDSTLNAKYALEFKPPFQTKREYLTGLGQSISYLQEYQYSGLILPYLADDGFKIANFVNDTLSSPEFKEVCTSLFAYDLSTKTIDILRPIDSQRKSAPKTTPNEIKTFWCWWRDLSHFEVYDLLNLSFMYTDEVGDIYSDHIFPEFYKRMINKQTKQWDGTPRNKNFTSNSEAAEKQNSKIPLVQLDLWSSSEGRLTNKGFKLLEIGKKYGANSEAFKHSLAYLILTTGKHLDLINIIEKFQKVTTVPQKSSDYAHDLEVFLDNNGFIGKRKPGGIKTGAKNSYLRDEMKLWNKFGLLLTKNTTQYFFPGIGYQFNWEQITNILRDSMDSYI
ncbi:hypothetical protein [Ruminococcus albus]|uniref:Uncharacterized protein n=1 Tax=Ruminococcus albus TaxID=1264 RepID=A0A1I1L833_RUMAL|nr:hypothetical protein [Ruminococcus albus]SFC67188.1 hypothetical protein SAMN02910406_02163 [Ruminococcus albus]